MKQKFLTQLKAKTKDFIKTKALSYGMTMGMCGLMFATHIALAGGGSNAGGLFKSLIEVLGKIFTAIGAFLAAVGVAHYAIANSDGDGPAKRKATMEMASGVALILVSVALPAANLEQYISS